MRRKDREITDSEQIRTIVAACKTCHVAMLDGGLPYLVPLSYGWELDGDLLTLYFHSAQEGRKLEALKKNPAVCFNLCREGELHGFENPCSSGYYFESVTGCGRVEFVEDTDEKCRALALLMKHQSGRDFIFDEKQASTVCVYKIATRDFTGKRKVRPQ